MTLKITRKKSDLGAVMTYIISPTRALFVLDESFPDKLWKFPGGGIEETDEGIIGAAIREIFEETGVRVHPEEMTFIRQDEHATDGTYFPNFFVASVSEEKLDSRKEITDENGKRMRTGVFSRSEVPTMIDFLERHRPIIHEIEGYERVEGSW